MGKQLLRYYFGAVALYIAVAHGTDLGNIFTKGASGVATITSSLEARS